MRKSIRRDSRFTPQNFYQLYCTGILDRLPAVAASANVETETPSALTHGGLYGLYGRSLHGPNGPNGLHEPGQARPGCRACRRPAENSASFVGGFSCLLSAGVVVLMFPEGSA